MTLYGYEELEQRLGEIAELSCSIADGSTNEESTKHYLILPFLHALGYNYRDPTQVQPEFTADWRSTALEKVDYVLFVRQTPTIAIECKPVGTALEQHRGQLRRYFSALESVRLGILTNGKEFEFFVDSDAPNIMDAEPFLSFDIAEFNSAADTSELQEILSLIAPQRFNISAIVDRAEQALLERRLRKLVAEEVGQPSAEFCRFLLNKVGIKGVRTSNIQTRYASTVRNAFTEAFVKPVVAELRAQQPLRNANGDADSSEGSALDARLITTDREIAVFKYVLRRLAFFARDEHEFQAIENVDHRDQLSKFVVYYRNVNKGRLFSFIEGANGYDRYRFPHPFGDIVTNSFYDIDEALAETFYAKVRDLDGHVVRNEQKASA